MKSMRDLISIICEGAVRRVFSATGEPFVIYEDPSRAQFDACLSGAPHASVKGLLSLDDGRLFVWPAWFAHHLDVSAKYGIESFIRLEMKENGPELSGGYGDAGIVASSKSIKRIYGQDVTIESGRAFQPAMMGIYDGPPTDRDSLRYANKIRRRLGMPRFK